MTLLEDGRFAFFLVKEHEDLRTYIDCKMMESDDHSCGPFSKERCEDIMYEVALKMNQLRKYSIVHRDLKAFNVLVNLSQN